MEKFTYPRATQVVVPSQGLARELRDEFPYIQDRLTVLPNPINLARLQKPADFDRQAFRESLVWTIRISWACLLLWDSLSAKDFPWSCRPSQPQAWSLSN